MHAQFDPLAFDQDDPSFALAVAPVLDLIDFKTLLIPSVAFTFPIAWATITGASITWAAQAGTLLVLATLHPSPNAVQTGSTWVRAQLDGVSLTPVFNVDDIVPFQYHEIPVITTGPIAAGNRTVRLQGQAADANRVFLDPGGGRLTVIVFPTAMIAP